MKEAAVDHGYIEEHNLPERYVLGQLDDAEQVSFEDHFVDCPRCLDAVEVVQELAAGLAAVDAAPSDAPLASVVSIRPRRRSAPGWIASALPRWAAAAVLALALLPSLWLARQNRDLASEVERLRRPWVATPAAVLELRRDAGPADAAPTVPASGQPWIPLAIDLADVAGLTVDVELYRGGDLLWTGTDLRPPDFGPLILSLPSHWLTPGRYRIELSLKAEGRVEPAGELRFEVVP
jgi:hypothetical protein